MSRLSRATAGIHTIEAIRPILLEWLNRDHLTLTLRLIPVLSGHGCFGRYLWRVTRREPTTVCHGCGFAKEMAQHTLEVQHATSLVAKIVNELSLWAVLKSMVDSSRS